MFKFTNNIETLISQSGLTVRVPFVHNEICTVKENTTHLESCLGQEFVKKQSLENLLLQYEIVYGQFNNLDTGLHTPLTNTETPHADTLEAIFLPMLTMQYSLKSMRDGPTANLEQLKWMVGMGTSLSAGNLFFNVYRLYKTSRNPHRKNFLSLILPIIDATLSTLMTVLTITTTYGGSTHTNASWHQNFSDSLTWYMNFLVMLRVVLGYIIQEPEPIYGRTTEHTNTTNMKFNFKPIAHKIARSNK